MEKIIKLGVVAVLFYVAFTYGRPWLERTLGGEGLGPLGGGGGGDALRCVQLAERANEHFGSNTIREARLPIDANRWSSAYQMARGRVEEARDGCDCTEKACYTARQALGDLESLMAEFDSAATGGTPPLNPAYSLEQIGQLLGQARRQATEP